MSGGGWWSDETGAKGVWMNPSPPPQTTASALENTEHLRSGEKQKNLFTRSCSASICRIFNFIHYQSIA